MRSTFVPSPLDGFQLETLDGETILLHPTRNIIIYGNQTGALIWQLCNGVRSVGEIVEILCAAYPEAQAEIRVDVPEIVQMLASRGAFKAE